MIVADKTKIIQDLQCKHATWLVKYNTAISIGTCVSSWTEQNIIISNLIMPIYRYKAFDEEVTNADIVQIDIATTDPTETYSIAIDYGATNLVTFVGTGTQEEVVVEIRNLINSASGTHDYYCVNVGNSLYLYTYDAGASYSDTPTLTYSELDATTVELVMATSSVTSTGLDPILDSWNCLTLTQLCNIICKVRDLLTDCKCN